MTSTGQIPTPWKSTAATLFNPYLNINQRSNTTRQQSGRTRTSTATTQQGRVPPESLVGASHPKVTSSESQKRPRSKHFPSSNAAEEVSIYVQQMIHCQNDLENEENLSNRTMSTANERNSNRKRIPLTREQTRVSSYELDEFFNSTNDQMSHFASTLLSHESDFYKHCPHRKESPKYKPNRKRSGFTLADMCNVASNIGDKMIQSREKVGLEAIRGFRLPSARLTYETHEHYPTDPSILLGQPVNNDRIHLCDVLADDNYSREAMVEFVDQNVLDERTSRASRNHPKSATSTQSKIIELKDWRGKITQGNLPDIRSQSRRQRAESVESPQRPCTAASNLSKSRPESIDELLDDDEKEEEIKIVKSENARSAPVGSALKNRSNSQQRQRSYPLNVRIDDTNAKPNVNQNTDREEYPNENLDPMAFRSANENRLDQEKFNEIIRPSSESILSRRTTPAGMFARESPRENLAPDSTPNRRSYKLIRSSTSYVYRTIPEISENPISLNEQFSQLSLPQLELLEHYDPLISTKIGAPFIPVQMLARPRDAQLSAKRSAEEIERDYPKKNGQPVFENPSARATNSIIEIAQTLQASKSKRIPVERQTTFERPDNEEPVEESLHIKSIENPNRLAIELYTPPKQNVVAQTTNLSKLSTKQNSSLSDYLSILDKQSTAIESSQIEESAKSNLSVINIRTQQEVDQIRPRKKPPQKRLTFPTTIVTNIKSNPKSQGRPIPSVFLTQDPDELNYSTSVYRKAKNDVNIKRVFKGYVKENLYRRLSADERRKREEEQQAAVKIQRAYREHLQRRDEIENRRPSSGEKREREKLRRQVLSAKRAQYVEQKLTEQTRIRDANEQLKQLVRDTGPSVEVFGQFNQVEAQFSKATLNRAATCIQRWWKGFLVRHRAKSLKEEVATFGSTWSQFISHYRDVIRRIQELRESKNRQFHFTRDQAKDFLTTEKKLTTIYNSMAFNDKFDKEEIEHFFECCDLSATSGEIQQALTAVLKYHPRRTDGLTKEMVFDTVYYIYPPLGTGLESTRQSTWVRPIIDGEDETAIQGTPFLEPIDMNVVYKFLGKPH
ncbi:unnamed protein product [Adineta ricciae]|uniref:Uncharacterized protein n=1 Tax=Adineta ricciae TaxID=249248 RepID=A0A815NC25_ADIRI|nr:unnamed protein product [Adineta ricciae]CAF1436216.1 unnamed protein product [Adineta ricciae]